jgi:hypothetical protein
METCLDREEDWVPDVHEPVQGLFHSMGREMQANVEPRQRLRASCVE